MLKKLCENIDDQLFDKKKLSLTLIMFCTLLFQSHPRRRSK